jgi:DNA-binding NarL/FixJ family response regulator
MTVIRVAIADEQTLYCSGIQMLIESQPDLEFVGAAHDGEVIVDLALSQNADIVLMNLEMPLATGTTATEIIRARAVGTPPKMIIFTLRERDGAVLHAVNAGASGFIPKDSAPAVLLDAIRSVHGGRALNAARDSVAAIQGLTPAATRRADQSAISSLSAREKQVFLLAARGLNNSDIATSADIVEATVTTHLAGVLTKLVLSSRLQIVAFAYQNGLLR